MNKTYCLFLFVLFCSYMFVCDCLFVCLYTKTWRGFWNNRMELACHGLPRSVSQCFLTRCVLPVLAYRASRLQLQPISCLDRAGRKWQQGLDVGVAVRKRATDAAATCKAGFGWRAHGRAVSGAQVAHKKLVCRPLSPTCARNHGALRWNDISRTAEGHV